MSIKMRLIDGFEALEANLKETLRLEPLAQNVAFLSNRKYKWACRTLDRSIFYNNLTFPKKNWTYDICILRGRIDI